MSGYVQLPGDNAVYPSTPNAAPVNLSGSFDIRFYGALDNWTDGYPYLIEKCHPSVIQGYSLKPSQAGNGKMRLLLGDDAANFASSSVAHGIANGADQWMRATFDISTGDVKFYLGGADPTPSWVQNGTTQNIAGVPSITNYAQPLEIMRDIGAADCSGGKVYRVVIYSDLTETTKVFDADFTDLTPAEIAAKAFTEDSANAATVTLNGTGWSYVTDPSGSFNQSIAGPGQLLRTGG